MSADRVEAVQQRAWLKRGSAALAAVGAYGVDDPFLVRGGGGLRATLWPRSLLGVTLEVSGWGQRPSDAARIAQRELRARLRPAGSAWVALGGVELSAADGKLAFGETILPFELFGRLSAGAAGDRDEWLASPTLALGAGLGLRWFATDSFGLETALAWRSGSIVRSLDGRDTAARETVLAFELAVPYRFGGAR